MKNPFQIPFIRNILGAVVGAGVAMAGYSVYQVGSGVVTAYLIPPGLPSQAVPDGSVRLADKSIRKQDSEKFHRISARAAMIARQISANADLARIGSASGTSAVAAATPDTSSGTTIAVSATASGALF